MRLGLRRSTFGVRRISYLPASARSAVSQRLGSAFSVQRSTFDVRCLAERILTFALGRTPEPYDLRAVKRISDATARDGCKLTSLMKSYPFRNRVLPSTGGAALHFGLMSHTITIRLTKGLAEWLEEESARTGQPQGSIVREQLEKSRKGGKTRPFMKLAGKINGPANLSQRKGFSRK